MFEEVRDRAHLTRSQILDEASRLFAERGYPGTSFADLIVATGLTKGAIYFHFPSKEALALAAFAHVQERWVAHVVGSTDASRPAVEQLADMLDASLEFAETDPAAACTHRLAVDLSQDPELRQRMAPYVHRWEEMVAWLIERGQREGDIRPGPDPRAAGRVAVGAFVGIQEVSGVTSGGAELRERAEEFLEFFLSGLGARRPARAH